MQQAAAIPVTLPMIGMAIEDESISSGGEKTAENEDED
jgi:hypothetical protein